MRSGARDVIVFAPLARMQVRFYVGMAQHLEERGYTCVFASFHEPSVPWIRNRGYTAFNVYEHAPRLEGRSLEELAAAAAGFGIQDLQRVLSHEKAFYELRDSTALARKLVAHLLAMTDILQQVSAQAGGTVHLVQELGGFLSAVGAFHSARRLGIDNTFMEPSFYRGRVFFTRNTFAAKRVPALSGEAPHEVARQVRAYLNETVQSRSLVVPVKDAPSYRSALSKVLNRHNVRRLFEKTLEKHVQGQREEFTHIGSHVRRHLRMVRNSVALRHWYTDVPAGRRFIYYPLHVPADVALTLRAPEYFDQYALIDFLARSVPPTHLLAIKEHPALVGAISRSRIRELLDTRDNVVLLPPERNNHDVMRAADAVVTVNSKSGAEALMQGRRVLALGDSFYRDCGLVAEAASVADVPAALRALLAAPAPAAPAVERFFQAVWQASLPGEIHDASDVNCHTFAASLDAALRAGGDAAATATGPITIAV